MTPFAISFAEPLLLLALVLLPFWFLAQRAAVRRRRKFAIRFPAAATVAGVMRAAPAWRRRLPTALLTLAAIVLVFALARPQATVAVPVEQAAVMLITDGSGSMAATDVKPTRLDAARDAAKRFLDRVPDGMQVGAVGFATTAHTVVAPSLRHDQVRAAIASLDADGGTATGDALEVALDALESRRNREGQRAPAAIVLLSDGKTTSGSDPLAAAERAKRLRIPVYTVSLGTPDGVVQPSPFQPPINVPPDPQTMREIAATSGGLAFEVDDGDELDQIYEKLGSQLGTRDERRDIAAGFAGAGLLLLLGGLGTGLRWRSAF
jgi:Ca-activated chloride channel family protein